MANWMVDQMWMTRQARRNARIAQSSGPRLWRKAPYALMRAFARQEYLQIPRQMPQHVGDEDQAGEGDDPFFADGGYAAAGRLLIGARRSGGGAGGRLLVNHGFFRRKRGGAIFREEQLFPTTSASSLKCYERICKSGGIESQNPGGPQPGFFPVPPIFSSARFFWAFPNPKKQTNLASMKFVTTLDRDEDGVWIAECPSIPGCVSQGDTRDEAIANIREAIGACLEVRAERGLPLTVEHAIQSLQPGCFGEAEGAPTEE